MTLNDLAIKHNTDKADFCHNYCPVYESLFNEIRFEAIGVLEIGVSEGASLKMWADYFPYADIYGIDKDQFDEGKFGSLGSRTETFVADQGNRKEMLDFVKEVKTEFDIIIDDGSHGMDDILVSLEILFPYLKIGGLYCIEDIEFPRTFDEHLKGYIHWFAVADSPILNSNLIVIRKNA